MPDVNAVLREHFCSRILDTDVVPPTESVIDIDMAKESQEFVVDDIDMDVDQKV